MGIRVTTATAPAYWASYFVNGDASGMNDREIELADAWRKCHEPWYVVDIVENSVHFSYSYDLHGGDAKGGDVCDYVMHRRTRKYVRAETKLAALRDALA